WASRRLSSPWNSPPFHMPKPLPATAMTRHTANASSMRRPRNFGADSEAPSREASPRPECASAERGPDRDLVRRRRTRSGPPNRDEPDLDELDRADCDCDDPHRDEPDRGGPNRPGRVRG